MVHRHQRHERLDLGHTHRDPGLVEHDDRHPLRRTAQAMGSAARLAMLLLLASRVVS